MKRSLRAVVAVVAVVGAIVVARQLPPPPSVAAGVEDSSELAGSSALNPDSVLEVPPTEDSGVAIVADPFAPVVIDPAVPTATAVVGQILSFAVPDADQSAITVTSDNPEVADVYAGDSDAEFDSPAGGDAISPGKTTITITMPDGKSSRVTLTVTE